MAENVIGGEFKIPLNKCTINQGTELNEILFSSGRGAFSAIINHLNNTIHKWGGVLMPDYLCSSITQVLIDQRINHNYYHIDFNLLPDEESLFSKIDNQKAVLLISYFGMVNIEPIAKKIKEYNSDIIIIIDDVQNFYSNNDLTYCDYRFNSFRKWFAIPDGASLFAKNDTFENPSKKNSFAQYKFSGNLLKNFSEWVDDNICLDLIEKGESELDLNYNCECSNISKTLIPNINHNSIKRTRKENAAYLHNELQKLGIKHIYNSETIPLFIPIFTDNRAILRKEFFSRNIFTPIHWPYESKELNGYIKNALYETELSLICDQRYTIEDMERQLEVIKSLREQNAI